jgi:primosomal protein N' (replication factor Y) (superfamily II helicase)
MAFLAEVLIPVAINKAYSYLIPEEYIDSVQVGVRVEVQFGRHKKLNSGIVCNIKEEDNPEAELKSINGVLDLQPIIHPHQLQFWQWMADYYACTLGEVMIAALPGAMKLNSDTYLVFTGEDNWAEIELDDNEYLIAEALSIQRRLSLSDLQGILQNNQILKPARNLVQLGIAAWDETLHQKYKFKTVDYVALKEYYLKSENTAELFELTKRSEVQTRAVLYLLKEHKEHPLILKKKWANEAEIDGPGIKRLVQKGIVEIIKSKDSRIETGYFGNGITSPMAAFQEEALNKINAEFENHNVCLVHGVTGSGKTRIYQELIQETIISGGQVLYLLPEISLSTQMEQRLRMTYGDAMLSYHSKINSQKKVEIWEAVFRGHPLIISARSGVFLPFKNLKLIIVDEEHDSSYKQQEPAPYYQARDVAIYLGKIFDAKVVLGSATPSLESQYQANQNKYGFVQIMQRFGDVEMPEIEIIDLRQIQKQNQLLSFFSRPLLDQIQETLHKKEKIILFQNRRGYSPMLNCAICDWKAQCDRCDISLTHHKYNNSLKCHYCNFTSKMTTECPKCGSRELILKGFGTEKIEDEIKIFIPDIHTQRFDADSTSSGRNLSQILESFDCGEINMLIGTQMVTKGLDFENVGLVGILLADQMIHYPDFRSSERAFQLFVQVAGRAGRRKNRGKVIIQTWQPEHPVIQDVLNMNFDQFYDRELDERKQFLYPPFVKLIQITIRHRDVNHMSEAANWMASGLKKIFGNRIMGPAVPNVARVKNLYQSQILIKIEKQSKVIAQMKQQVLLIKSSILKQSGKSNTRIIIDVDPF